MSIKEKIIAELSTHHSYEVEFRDSVIEVLDDVLQFDSHYDPEEIEQAFLRLMEPDRLIRFKVEWIDDNEIIHVNRGYRVQMNNSLGPYKGGLRFHPSVNPSILKFLAFEQTFKNALTGLPMGGGKGGSDFNPKGRSENEIRNFCNAFMEELSKYIGPHRDIPAGDIGVGTREIGYMYGHHLKLTGRFDGVLTGKHPTFGGSCGREEATGYGCVYFLKEALKFHDKSLKGRTCSISGAGNVALFTAEKLIEEGAKVISVSDSGGTLYFKHGIDKEQLGSLKVLKFEKRERLSAWSSSHGEYLDGKKPWHLSTEIAIPCATQNEVSGEDAKNLCANGVLAICEGANNPLDHNALEIALSKNVIFLPGKAANAGGVAISGIERSQNATHRPLSKTDVEDILKEIMSKIHSNCCKFVEKRNGILPYKLGANLYGFDKVIQATFKLRGKTNLNRN